MTEDEMRNFTDQCYEEMEKKNRRLQDEYGLGSFQEYWMDQESGTLQFKNEGKVEAVFSVIFMGTFSKGRGEWLWAWANQSLLASVRERSTRLKKLAELTGEDVFLEERLEADESLAWEIAALSLHALEAEGLYRIPGEKSDLFLALMGKA